MTGQLFFYLCAAMTTKDKISEIENLILFRLGGLTKRIFKVANQTFSSLQFPVQAEQIRVLFELYYGGELSQQQIADSVCRDKSSIQRTLTYMHKHALITIEQDPGDKRRNLVRLTAEGVQLTRSVIRELKKINDNVSAVLTADEKAEFIRLCAKMEEVIPG